VLRLYITIWIGSWGRARPFSFRHRIELGPFIPLVRNPHLATILAHFWRAGLDLSRYPVRRRLVGTEAEVEVLVETQRPASKARARSFWCTVSKDRARRAT